MNQPSPQTATLLINPTARRVARHFDVDGARRHIERQGVVLRVQVPDSPQAFAWAACESADRGDDLLFTAGGDGTLRLAAGAVAGSETALAALPGGTANVWAKECGLPLGFRTAIDAHLAGQRVVMDLGRAGDEAFILMAGTGWDAAIASQVSRPVKQRVGPAAYLIRGARDLPSLRSRPMRWRTPEGEFTADAGILLASNSRLYGGMVRFSPGALVDDGLLDLCVVAPHGPGAGIRMATRLVLGRLEGDPDVVRARVTEVAIETPGLPVQLDGDPLLQTPVLLRVDPGALRMSIPAGPLPAVFGASHAP